MMEWAGSIVPGWKSTLLIKFYIVYCPFVSNGLFFLNFQKQLGVYNDASHALEIYIMKEETSINLSNKKFYQILKNNLVWSYKPYKYYNV